MWHERMQIYPLLAIRTLKPRGQNYNQKSRTNNNVIYVKQTLPCLPIFFKDKNVETLKHLKRLQI